MHLKLIRLNENETSTPGILTYQDALGWRRLGYTLERPWKDNKRNVSCIPVGTYELELTNSPRFGMVYTVKGVPDRSAIHIHRLNYVTETQGCIGVGSHLGVLKGHFALLKSREVFELLIEMLKDKKDITLHIIRDHYL